MEEIFASFVADENNINLSSSKPVSHNQAYFTMCQKCTKSSSCNKFKIEKTQNFTAANILCFTVTIGHTASEWQVQFP